MLALVLWVLFGWRWGVLEVATELAAVVIVGGGGGGKRALAGYRRIRTHGRGARRRVRVVTA
jgi:hypothetical protein